MKDTLAIIGSHPRTRNLFDFNRTDAEVWVFNEALSNHTFPRADVVFQIHVPTIWRNPQNRNDPKHYEWLKTQDECNIVMQEAYEDVRRSKPLPLQGILDMLDGDPDHFLSSSVSEALAYAVYLGFYKHIEIYGVAMESNTEYQWQREGVAFWRGFAKGKGIDVKFFDETFRCPIYGYEGKVNVEYEELERRIEELKPKVEEVSSRYSAGILDVQKAVNLFVGDGSKEIESALIACIEKQVATGKELGFLDGAKQENERYKGKADVMRQADGGKFIFSRQEFESGAKVLTDKANNAKTIFISLGTHLGSAHSAIMSAAKGSPKRKKLANTFLGILKNYLDANIQVALYQGAAQEDYRYMAYLDKHVRAAGGARSEAVLLESMQNA